MDRVDILKIPFENLGIDVNLDCQFQFPNSYTPEISFNDFFWIESLFAHTIYENIKDILIPDEITISKITISFKFTECPVLKGFDDFEFTIKKSEITGAEIQYCCFGSSADILTSDILKTRLGTLYGTGGFGMLVHRGNLKSLESPTISFLPWPSFKFRMNKLLIEQNKQNK